MYKITIHKSKTEAGDKFHSWEDVYEQIVEDVNVKKVIETVNEPSETE